MAALLSLLEPGQTAAVLGGTARARQALLRPLSADLHNAPIGYVGGEPCFLDRFTALENAALPLCIRGVARGEREKAAMKLLQDVGLRPVAFARPDKLTYPERLRLCLARALAGEPPLLLLDDVADRIPEAELARWRGILAQYRSAERIILEFSQEETLLSPDRVFRFQKDEIVEEHR